MRILIALDTNVLVRFLTGDEPDQQADASLLLDRLTPAEPGFVAREVVLELVWVLNHGYGLSRKRIAEILEALLDTSGLLFEHAADVSRAAAEYGRGGPKFADRMILAAAERSGAGPLFTFDRDLARVRGASAIPVRDTEVALIERSASGEEPTNPENTSGRFP